MTVRTSDTTGENHCNIPIKDPIRIFNVAYFISTNNCWASNKRYPLINATPLSLRISTALK